MTCKLTESSFKPTIEACLEIYIHGVLVLFLCLLSMQRYMTCKGSCLASAGADQPAEVADDAPRDLVFHLYIFSYGTPLSS